MYLFKHICETNHAMNRIQSVIFYLQWLLKVHCGTKWKITLRIYNSQCTTKYMFALEVYTAPKSYRRKVILSRVIIKDLQSYYFNFNWYRSSSSESSRPLSRIRTCNNLAVRLIYILLSTSAIALLLRAFSKANV